MAAVWEAGLVFLPSLQDAGQLLAAPLLWLTLTAVLLGAAGLGALRMRDIG